jgi:protein tyrosine phosphatase type 4A
MQDLVFDDGSAPPDQIIDRWLDICEKRFKKKQAAKDAQGNELNIMYSDPAIAVHCVAGLGRAPVLVAIALIEEGVEPLKAVNLIRDKRRGAINQKQLKYLEESYRRRKKSRCIVM